MDNLGTEVLNAMHRNMSQQSFLMLEIALEIEQKGGESVAKRLRKQSGVLGKAMAEIQRIIDERE